MSTIAFIGLGHMGAPMSAHLVAAGHTVRGVDLNPAAAASAAGRGVQIVASVAAALDGADAVITSLPKPEHVRAVYGGADGILAHAAASTLLLDTSTVDVETSRWCHREAADRGLAFVDAPISGGTAGAEAHTLTFMLGGDTADVERARGIVAPMAGNVIACGEAGAGIAAKLVNNMMLFISVMAVSEGSQLAEQLGLDPQVFWDVARVSSADSWALRTWYPVPGIVDHMGHTPVAQGLDAPGFSALRSLVRDHGYWVKLSGAYRISERFPTFDDVTPFAQALIDDAPDRMVWGSDWPHVSLTRMPNTGALRNLLPQWAPDPEVRRRILVDNPARLYGFAATV